MNKYGKRATELLQFVRGTVFQSSNKWLHIYGGYNLERTLYKWSGAGGALLKK